ncbi:unnamed protein product [Notodromas monacha]|uniref:G-protein coupled receptors family 1 profile domain-containing protein n=1 Tax=Notodromas monacha TaxID=399045 RepID=A0A7R9BMV5_9CRUS|nr:unnamed protein product [Notodromas monacha]CAG0917549.1 unnamed protein product [Notodromas monacha]
MMASPQQMPKGPYHWDTSGHFANNMPHVPEGSSTYRNGSIVDVVPADLLYLVDPFWYQFPPMPTLMHQILGMVMWLTGIAAVVGNFIVLYVFVSNKTMRTPSNMLIVNLAFSDFIMMAGMFPFQGMSAFYEVWVFGGLMCELHGFIGTFSGCMQIWTLTLISYDRYNVIVKGIGAKPLSFKKVAAMLLLVDGIAFAWAWAPMLGWNKFTMEGNMTVCGSNSINADWNTKSFIFCIFTYAYITPLSTIIFCYFHIVKAVAVHERQMREQAKKMNVQSLRTGDDGKTSAEIRLAKIAIMTIFLWFFAWTPYVVINFIGIFYQDRITPMITIWGSTLSKLSAVYNPIVYGISHPRYKTAVNETFPCLSCFVGKPEDDTKSVVTTESGDTNRQNQETAA